MAGPHDARERVMSLVRPESPVETAPAPLHWPDLAPKLNAAAAAQRRTARVAARRQAVRAEAARRVDFPVLAHTEPPTEPRRAAEEGERVGEATMCISVEQCHELLVELQQLRLRLTALEQMVANAAQVGELVKQVSCDWGR